MAIIPDLIRRDRVVCDDDGFCYDESDWYVWGRWVFLGAIVVGSFLIFFIFSCITARRRRRNGMRPFYGTGWAAQGQPQYYQQGYPQGAYYGGNQYYQGPPPQYQHNPNQQTGVEMQPPNQSYQPQRGGEEVYSPPAGPPPGKH